MRVLVTGMGGELGTRVVNLFEHDDSVTEICGIDAYPPRRRIHRVSFHRIDPVDRRRTVAVVREFDPEVIVHLGVYEPNARLAGAAAQRGTAASAVSVLGAASSCPSLRSIVVRSGIEVYGRGRGSVSRPDETVAVRPTSPFGNSLALVERVAREGEPLLTSNAQTDDRLSLRVSVQALGLRSILCVPLKVQGRITGVIYVDNRLQAGLFTPDDLELLSSIAHSAAIAIAASLGAEKLVYLTDVPGVLTDVDDPASLVSRLSASRVRLLIDDGIISGGMIPKVEACLDAISAGVGSAHILDGRIPHVVLLELLTDAGVGTMITRLDEVRP